MAGDSSGERDSARGGTTHQCLLVRKWPGTVVVRGMPGVTLHTSSPPPKGKWPGTAVVRGTVPGVPPTVSQVTSVGSRVQYKLLIFLINNSSET